MPFFPLYIAKLNLVCGGAEELIEGYGYTEDDCPVDLMPVHDGSLFRNGRPIQAVSFAPLWLPLGESSDHIDFDEHGQEIFYCDVEVAARWHWCQTHAKGDWYVRAVDPTDGAGNARDLFVMFDLSPDEKAFIATFPEVEA